jgi:Activator of Hsp90 ATPase homolog 1-like protein
MSAARNPVPGNLVQPMVEESIRTFTITREERIQAPIDIVFETLLEQLGPLNEKPDSTKMPMKLEPWPGGRWFRDLGNNTGHLWCHVQAIRAPELLEMYGPMFMSFPATSNVQFRLSVDGKGTRVNFSHTAMGVIPDEVSANVGTGWDNVLKLVREKVERR